MTLEEEGTAAKRQSLQHTHTHTHTHKQTNKQKAATVLRVIFSAYEILLAYDSFMHPGPEHMHKPAVCLGAGPATETD